VNNVKAATPLTTAAGVAGLDAQRQARLDRAVRDARRLYPDSPELQRAAIQAAIEYLAGTTDMAAAGAELSRVRREAQQVRARVRQIATMAAADGHSERGVARAVGVDRMMVRRWLGKPKPLTGPARQGNS
jgi:uncharacterized membrane protein